MTVKCRLSKDAERIAAINKTVHDVHYKLYPEYFKPFSYNETVNFLKKQLQEENWFCYIADYEGKDTGYALFYIRDYRENHVRKAYKGIHIDQIGIIPEYRRKGIGRELMKEIEKFAIKENAAQIELTHWELNEDAKYFYSSMGFNTTIRFVVKKL